VRTVLDSMMMTLIRMKTNKNIYDYFVLSAADRLVVQPCIYLDLELQQVKLSVLYFYNEICITDAINMV